MRSSAQRDDEETGVAPTSLTGLFATPPLVMSYQANAESTSRQEPPDAAPSEVVALSSLFVPPPAQLAPPPTFDNVTETTPLTSLFSPTTPVKSNEHTALLFTDNTMEGGGDDDDDGGAFDRFKQSSKAVTVQIGQDSWSLCWNRFMRRHPIIQSIFQPTTLVGSLMFLLYHVVFVLAFGSAIMRPHATGSILSVVAKWTTVGIVGAGPLFIYRLNQDIPAVYPSVDLFLAPFFAQAAAIVDQSLWEQSQAQGHDSYPDSLFFGTFSVLTSVGMFITGTFLWLGSRFKLANLGAYLPYSVLSGFFSAVGVLLWCLAFAVDTSGHTWKMVFLSGDWAMIGNALLHHVPSLAMGIIMNRLGPKNPFYIILLISMTISAFYLTLWVAGKTLKDAADAGWFWSLEELVYHHPTNETTAVLVGKPLLDVPSWSLPPCPFGSFAAILAGNVNFRAVSAGLGNMVALAFLYLLRSSIHASAMKKNVSNLVMRIPIKPNQPRSPAPAALGTIDLGNDEEAMNATIATGNASPHASRPTVFERVTESVRIVNMSMQNKKPLRVIKNDRDAEPEYTEIRAKAPRRSLEGIFSEYAYTLFAVAFVGGFGVCPTVATSNTMYAIGASAPAPQYGSILLLLFFYFSDFRLVEYIPKMAFSSLLVLGAVDTLVVWFFGAFRKTQDLSEWLVVPLIAGFSLFVGFLNAVFLGIAISMFVFVASFFRVGVVKYSASGLEIRSRIERSVAESAWLNENGDLCQVLVLQNYLFFGNASSILNYIATMFEEVDETQSQRLDFSLPPIPKILVLDLSLVSGMDTSTIDIFAEIYEFCQNNDCQLYLCGLSSRMKKGLELGGVKPDRRAGRHRRKSKSSLRFFSDLDTALGRAEDTLIETQMMVSTGDEPTPRRIRSNKSLESMDGNLGFRRALKQIDELHGLSLTLSLMDLESYIEPIELKPGERLYACDGGVVEESHRGLLFVEEGMLKIERDSTHSLTWTRSSIGGGSSQYTLKNQHARMGSLARRAALAREGKTAATTTNLRLARLGPGWVCGIMDFGTGIRSSGITVAVTKCRLHLLPFAVVEQLEKEDPALVLCLYKLVTHLRAYREEATIEQLTTLNNILTSPAHSKPLSRAAIRALGP